MIKIENLKFKYPDQKKFLLSDIHVELPENVITEIAGISGSGKTTLQRIINGIIPHIYNGFREGEVWVDGKDPGKSPIELISRSVSTLIQNFELQLFKEYVNDEIDPFSPLAEMFGVDKLAGKKVRELSSGEKQRVLILKILQKRTATILMDEPFSSLDNDGRNTLREILKNLKKTIIIFSHEYNFVDSRKFVLHNGRLEIPVKEEWRKLGVRRTPYDFSLEKTQHNGVCPLISTKGVTFSYNGKDDVLKGIDLEIHPGEIVGISGANGSGKTTLARVIAGFLKHRNGHVYYQGREVKGSLAGSKIGLVFHDPYTQIFGLRVKDFVSFQNGLMEKFESLGLNIYPDSRILRLSRGELMKLAIATNTDYELIIYDEPANGLDYISLKKFAGFLGKLRESGKAILIFSHDLEFLNRVSDKRFEIKGGKLIEL